MTETAHAAAEEEAKEAVSEAIGKVKDTVAHTTHKASDKAQEMKEKGTFWCSSVCLVSRMTSSYVLAGVLPRQQFAMVQSKMYPVYFRAMAYGIGTALLGHLTGLRRFSPLSMGMLQVFNLMAAEAMVLVNLMYFEPRATKVMVERMKKEKEEGQGKEGEAKAEVAGKAGQEKLEAGKSRVLQRLNSYVEDCDPEALFGFRLAYPGELHWNWGYALHNWSVKVFQHCFTDWNIPVGLMLLGEFALGDIHGLTKAQYMDMPLEGSILQKGFGKNVPLESEYVKWRDDVVVSYGKISCIEG